MVVDIGGGTTDIAVLSLGGIVVDSSVRIGGDHFDEAIVRHVKKVHNVLIGERTAEEIKMAVATVSKNGRNESITVRGRDMVTGLPTTFTGGGALLDGLAEVMQKETGITTRIAEDPLECVALGTGKALENLDKLHPGTVYTVSNLDV